MIVKCVSSDSSGKGATWVRGCTVFACGRVGGQEHLRCTGHLGEHQWKNNGTRHSLPTRLFRSGGQPKRKRKDHSIHQGSGFESNVRAGKWRVCMGGGGG